MSSEISSIDSAKRSLGQERLRIREGVPVANSHDSATDSRTNDTSAQGTAQAHGYVAKASAHQLLKIEQATVA